MPKRSKNNRDRLSVPPLDGSGSGTRGSAVSSKKGLRPDAIKTFGKRSGPSGSGRGKVKNAVGVAKKHKSRRNN